MARSRRTPPLFDLLGSDRAPIRVNVPPAAQPSAPAPPPAPSAARPAPSFAGPPPARAAVAVRSNGAAERRPEGPGPSPGFDEPVTQTGRVLRVPLEYVLVAVTVVIGLLAVTWAGAYRVGANAERNRIARTAVGERGAGGGGSGGGEAERAADPLIQPGSGDRSVPPSPPPRRTDAAPPGAGTPAWEIGVEPRVAGHNYLLVVRLPWEQALPAALFLTENGVPAAALPVNSSVDPAEAAANNAEHQVVVLEGFAGDGFSRFAARQEEIQREVVRIGRLYKAAAPGNDDFARAKHLWSKFRG